MKGNTLERFEAKFVRTEGCWLWNACASPAGYGFFYFDGQHGLMNAHRASWMLYRGPIPDGMQVLHNCPDGDTPRCVRPDHLFLGTQCDNMEDKVGKGRQAEGERHGLAKMTDRKVMELRAAMAAGISISIVTEFFDIHHYTAYSIAKGKTWDHVTASLTGDDLEETLAIFRFFDDAYAKEKREKYSRNAQIGAEKKKAEVAARPPETTRVCRGPLCEAGVVHPIDNFYVKDKKTGRRMAVCKACFYHRDQASKKKRLYDPAQEQLP